MGLRAQGLEDERPRAASNDDLGVDARTGLPARPEVRDPRYERDTCVRRRSCVQEVLCSGGPVRRRFAVEEVSPPLARHEPERLVGLALAIRDLSSTQAHLLC